MLPVTPLNRVYVTFAGLVLSFILMIASFDWVSLIVLLNGAMIGAALAVMLIYGRLFTMAIRGIEPYNDVKQFATSVALQWICIGLAVTGSIQMRMEGYDNPPLFATLLMRYVAVVAAILQVTVSDWGLGFFYGRDRKTLYGAMLAGLAAALVAIYMQVYEVFAI